MSDHELLLRCDCSGDVMACDIWLKRGMDPVPYRGPFSGVYKVEDYEAGYLTFYVSPGKSSWGHRLKMAWRCLWEPEEACISCVILRPNDVLRLREYLLAFAPEEEAQT